MGVTVRPTHATLGAVVTGVALRDLDDSAWRAIEDAWHTHGVLVFPDQHLTNDEQVAFSRRLGRLERLAKSNTPTERVDISRLSNLRADGTLVTDENEPTARMLIGNMGWHSDSSFRPVSAKASLLAAQTVPRAGGNTEFADMRAAYDALSDAVRQRLEGLVATHSYAYSQGKVGGLEAVFSPEARAAMVDVEHPLVRVHPATGRRSLFIGRHVYRIRGMDDTSAQALLEELLDFACRPPRVFAHEWRAGDLVLWDNRCVLHRARPWDFNDARVMFHTRVAGDGANEYALADDR
jgi:alpha-ketoglutarate-dependent taurine dioxygenase